MTHTLLRRIAVGSGALTIALTTALSGVAAADETPTGDGSSVQQHTDQPTPKFDVSIKFDHPSYHSGDTVTGSIKITNTGEALVPAVRLVAGSDNLKWDIKDWQSIWLNGPGVAMAPGATEVRTFTGSVIDPSKPIKGWAIVRVYEPVDSTFRADDAATVTPTTGSIHGTLYGDVNGNGKFDKGEGLSGVQVTITGGVPSKTLPAAQTDADGKFAFKDIPSGPYTASFGATQGYVLPAAQWQVDDKALEVTVQGRRPVADTLKASVKLNADTYAVGDTAHVTVTLTNSGDYNLAGITAACDRSGESHAMGGDLSGWGDLAIGQRGVTVLAHGTVTVDVTSPVPAEAHRYGYTDLSCDFGQFPAYPEGVHAEMVLARVTGAVASVEGTLLHDKTAVAGVKIYLTDHIVKKIVASTVTDAAGKYKFTGVPAGLYDIGLVGPWKLVDSQPWTLFEGDNPGADIAVAPGQDQPDPSPTTPTAPTTPAPQASPVLANTGAADVATLTGAAIGALVIGLTLVLLSRRRRTS
ncbi:SdrD B-like domain-containing protein [Kutzneria sp. NPDC052558]|uniref:SdrD B-like domain-containing protein n=1 Tax=Kutzneria sp. NPDC052558 TaxID=3364121 RepID=UPI0037CBA3E8